MRPSLGGWRIAARLARRELRRRPALTALVAALVAIPVAGMFVAVTLYRTGELSAPEQWRLEHGTADAVMFAEAELPEGSRSVDFARVTRVLETADGRLCRCVASDMPADPMTDGLVRMSDGRLPQSDDEVVLSEPAARQLDVGLGDRLSLERPYALDATVVGIGRLSRRSDTALLLVHPGAVTLESPGEPERRWLVDLPDELTPTDPTAEGQPDPVLGANFPETYMAGENANDRVRWTWAAGAAGLTVLGIVITAAFAAGARRQLVTLGQLSANGAPPAVLRRALFLQGSMTGLAGAALGLVTGGVVLGAIRPWADGILGHARMGWDTRLLDVLPIVAIAVVAATVAAMIPAFAASRVSVLTTLAGRRPLGRPSRRRTTLGGIVVAGGLAVLAVAARIDGDGQTDDFHVLSYVLTAVGPVLVLLGVCAAMPAIVTVLHPVARATRGSWRLAARSLLRQRTRTSALVSAVCAIVAVAVAVAAIGLGLDRDDTDHRDQASLPDGVVRIGASIGADDGSTVLPPPEVLGAAATDAHEVVPAAQRFEISHGVPADGSSMPTLAVRRFVPEPGAAASLGGDGYGLVRPEVVIVDDDLQQAYELDATTQRRLDEHGSVWFGPTNGRATVGPFEGQGFEIATVVVGPDHLLGLVDQGDLLLTPERAADAGLVPAPAEVVLRSPEPLTMAQVEALEQIRLRLEADMQEVAGGTPTGFPSAELSYVAPRDEVASTGLVETAPAAVALLFALGVVAIGLALAGAESADERNVLAALGAPPRTLRRTNGAKALLLTLVAAVTAVPLGLGPVAVVARLGEDGLPFVVPWRTIALVVLAVPLLAAAVTTAATRARHWQVSTATFE
jgi:putative ABC transport system permease protein